MPKKILTDLSKTITKRNDAPDGETYRQGVIDTCAFLLNGGSISDMEYLIQCGELPKK
jgi:hypothetical protein